MQLSGFDSQAKEYIDPVNPGGRVPHKAIPSRRVLSLTKLMRVLSINPRSSVPILPAGSISSVMLPVLLSNTVVHVLVVMETGTMVFIVAG